MTAHLSVFLWISLGGLALVYLTNKIKNKKIIYLFCLLILFENIPFVKFNFNPKIKTIRENKIYNHILNYPSYYGIFELPSKKSLLSTIYHNKHVYAGNRLGVGEVDPLDLEKYNFHSIKNKIIDSSFIDYLRNNSLYIIIIHKQYIKNRNARDRIKPPQEIEKEWDELKKTFLEAKEMGYFANLIIKKNRISAILNSQRKGEEITMTLPTFYLEKLKKLEIKIITHQKKNSIELIFNDNTIKEITFNKEGNFTIEINLKKIELNLLQPNILKLKSKNPITFQEIL